MQDFIVQKLNRTDTLIVSGIGNLFLVDEMEEIGANFFFGYSLWILVEVSSEAEQVIAIGLARLGTVAAQLHFLFDPGRQRLLLGGEFFPAPTGHGFYAFHIVEVVGKGDLQSARIGGMDPQAGQDGNGRLHERAPPVEGRNSGEAINFHARCP